jgi:hypothetical protein
LLVAGVLLGARLLFSRPVEATLALSFGPRAAEVRELELIVTDGKENVVRSLKLAFPQGAPPEERRAVRLQPGDYTLGVRIARDKGGPLTLTRPLRVGDAGSYPIDLSYKP